MYQVNRSLCFSYWMVLFLAKPFVTQISPNQKTNGNPPAIF
ncbi:hypothetical protein ABID29_000960 [Streptococcus rupicaprae]|uniref:Uncharacterized protein n=1 Tax=Streptococcus rupicaprae TaxID=759619 RepID=A0ABV2FH70_9STRE